MTSNPFVVGTDLSRRFKEPFSDLRHQSQIQGKTTCFRSRNRLSCFPGASPRADAHVLNEKYLFQVYSLLAHPRSKRSIGCDGRGEGADLSSVSQFPRSRADKFRSV